jgi:hypothetical protein
VLLVQVEHWNLTRYLNMVLESDWHDDLDVARQAVTTLHDLVDVVFYMFPDMFFDQQWKVPKTLRAILRGVGRSKILTPGFFLKRTAAHI